MSFLDLGRKEFVNRLNHFVHPSEEISIPDQLIGRDEQLLRLRNCFESPGAHAFVWGQRGVGKTSLVHSACAKFDETVSLAAAVACEEKSTPSILISDVFRKIVSDGKIRTGDKSYINRLSVFGLSIAGNIGKISHDFSIKSVNYASDLLNTIMPQGDGTKKYAVIFDEFDKIQNQETVKFFTDLVKQLSVDSVSTKLIFCGVASNLNDLIGAHESVDRYIHAVELKPLGYDHIKEVVNRIFENFSLKPNNGQAWRISQISCGFPHFAHLICREIINICYEDQHKGPRITESIYKRGIYRAARGAALRLQKDYETATTKPSRVYVEALWAAANGPHLERQFKEISEDYLKIFLESNQSPQKCDSKNIRRYLNNLCQISHGAPLTRRSPGWYKFNDPMFRSYVRMMAHCEGIDLGDESFVA